MTAVKNRIRDRTATVAVVGVGYVGLPLACHFSDAGFGVIGYDIDEDRVNALLDGISYVDDVPNKDVERALDVGFKPTNNPETLSDADVFVVAVPTDMNGTEPDMRAVRQATRTVGEHAPNRETLFVCSSTVYPGAAEEIIKPELRAVDRSSTNNTLVAVVPERINPGGRYDFEDIPLIVGADSERERETAQNLFNTVTVGTVPVGSTKAAEMAKTLENTYRMVNIGLVNEMARYAEEIGVDIWEVIEASGTKPFGFQEFYPGPGVGGHCIPVDPQFLTWLGRRHDQPLSMVEKANGMNERMPTHIVNQVRTGLEARGVPIEDASVTILGLTYKPNIADVRNAPALAICESFLARDAQIRTVDPHVQTVTIDGERITPANEIHPELIADSDAVVVLVDHDVFEYDGLEAAPFVFDAQNAVPDELSTPMLRLGDGRTADIDQLRRKRSATSTTTFQS